MADYERIRPHLYPPEPVDAARWRAWAAEQARGDVVLWFTVDGFFWFARRLLGIERHLFAFYDQPELMHRINSDLADWILLVIEQVCSICTPDFMTFGEDMSYNNGPMLSKDCFDQFMRPYYDRVMPRGFSPSLTQMETSPSPPTGLPRPGWPASCPLSVKRVSTSRLCGGITRT
jgi:hypothetical protein